MKKKELDYEELARLFKPVGDFVLLDYITNDKTSTGIVIPEGSRVSEWGLPVIAVGEAVTKCSPGDIIIVDMQNIPTFEKLGRKFGLVREYNVVMIVSPDYKMYEPKLTPLNIVN